METIIQEKQRKRGERDSKTNILYRRKKRNLWKTLFFHKAPRPEVGHIIEKEKTGSEALSAEQCIRFTCWALWIWSLGLKHLLLKSSNYYTAHRNVILVQITIFVQKISRTYVWLKPFQVFRGDSNEPFCKWNKGQKQHDSNKVGWLWTFYNTFLRLWAIGDTISHHQQ